MAITKSMGRVVVVSVVLGASCLALSGCNRTTYHCRDGTVSKTDEGCEEHGGTSRVSSGSSRSGGSSVFRSSRRKSSSKSSKRR